MGKTHKDRDLLLVAQVVEALSHYHNDDVLWLYKCLKKIAEKSEVTTSLSMHISRHAFAHIAQEAGAESSSINNILSYSNLATSERYMGNFDTSKTDATLRTLFKKEEAPKPTDSSLSPEKQAVALLESMTPAQFISILSAINK